MESFSGCRLTRDANCARRPSTIGGGEFERNPSPARARENGAADARFADGLAGSAELDSAIALGLLDLAENRLDDRFSARVHGLAFRGSELRSHRLALGVRVKVAVGCSRSG